MLHELAIFLDLFYIHFMVLDDLPLYINSFRFYDR